ncbi:MAG: hypothetical protein M1347_03900 [Chloroflexi bacterium]|nr:hypothetical protein [Chloroflexota bacterium]
MVKKKRSQEEHLEAIQLLLAAIVMKRDVGIKTVAKITGFSDNTLSELFPEKKKKKKLAAEG